MKYCLTLFALVLFFSQINAQTSLDSTFATDGYTQDVDNIGIAHDVAVQADGKILMAMGRRKLYANTNSPDEWNLYCARYLPNGMPDTGFGNNGLGRIGGIPKAEAKLVDVQSDGKIIIVGKSEYCGPVVCGYDNIIVGRLHADGSHDTTFGISLASPYIPKTITGAEEVFGQLYLGTEIMGMKVLANNQIMIMGNIQSANNFAWTSTIYNSFVIKLNADGSVDSSFSQAADGILKLPTNGTNDLWGSIRDWEVDAQGNMFFLGGKSEQVSPGNYRYTSFVGKVFASGAIDSTFGTFGVKTMDLGSFDQMQSIDIDAAGNVLVAGHQTAYGDSATVVLLNSAGQFSAEMTGGHSFIAFPKNEKGYINTARFDTQGRICIAGYYLTSATNTRIGYIARLNRDGSWDNAFTAAGAGIDTLDLSVQARFVATVFHDMEMLPNGQILLAGERIIKAGTVEPHGLLARISPADIALGNEPDLVSILNAEVFPNPIQRSSVLRFEAPKAMETAIEVFSAQGRLVQNIVQSKSFARGNHSIDLGELMHLPKGQYYILLRTEVGNVAIPVVR